MQTKGSLPGAFDNVIRKGPKKPIKKGTICK